MQSDLKNKFFFLLLKIKSCFENLEILWTWIRPGSGSGYNQSRSTSLASTLLRFFIIIAQVKLVYAVTTDWDIYPNYIILKCLFGWLNTGPGYKIAYNASCSVYPVFVASLGWTSTVKIKPPNVESGETIWITFLNGFHSNIIWELKATARKLRVYMRIYMRVYMRVYIWEYPILLEFQIPGFWGFCKTGDRWG